MKEPVFHFQQFDIRQSHAAMKVGTDSDLLGALAVGGKNILDIGTGTGVLALMMAQRFPKAHITAIEIDEQAVIDAQHNFSESRFSHQIALHHTSFQEYVRQHEERALFDSVVCNPPYFDRSLECPSQGRTRARHSSSLPFSVLAQGAFLMLDEEGYFSVCLPPEVLEDFIRECRFAGFYLAHSWAVKTLPHKEPKRFIVVFKKGIVNEVDSQTFVLSNADHSRSDWYLELMKDFLLLGQ